MTFQRDNNKNKKGYYYRFVLVELGLLFAMYYYGVHWAILFLVTPIFLIDVWSNIRCANRQKKYIKEIEITDAGIICQTADGFTETIPREKALFSIRENKFEKEKTEIEIRFKRSFKSRLVGRLHIKNWQQIFEIKEELVKQQFQQIKYRPEGYWSKYGTLTADVAITGAALGLAAIAKEAGSPGISSDAQDILMPIHQVKHHLDKANEPLPKKSANKKE